MSAYETLEAWLYEHGHKLHVEAFQDRAVRTDHHICTWWGVKGRVVIVQQFPRQGFEVYIAAAATKVPDIINELESIQ